MVPDWNERTREREESSAVKEANYSGEKKKEGERHIEREGERERGKEKSGIHVHDNWCILL